MKITKLMKSILKKDAERRKNKNLEMKNSANVMDYLSLSLSLATFLILRCYIISFLLLFEFQIGA